MMPSAAANKAMCGDSAARKYSLLAAIRGLTHPIIRDVSTATANVTGLLMVATPKDMEISSRAAR